MVWPSLWQYGALPAGGSWQLQERSLPGGSSEVLRQVWSSYYLDYVCLICCFQLHVLNGWIKSGLWIDLYWAFLWGEGLGPAIFSADIWIWKMEGEQIFAHPITLDFCNSTIENIELDAQLRTLEHWAGGSIEDIWTLVLQFVDLSSQVQKRECTLDARGVLWAGGSIVNISTESWA